MYEHTIASWILFCWLTIAYSFLFNSRRKGKYELYLMFTHDLEYCGTHFYFWLCSSSIAAKRVIFVSLLVKMWSRTPTNRPLQSIWNYKKKSESQESFIPTFEKKVTALRTKGTTCPRVEGFDHIVTAFKSHYKLIKIQLQYLDQSSASKPWLKTAWMSGTKFSFKILTSFSLHILTEIQHQSTIALSTGVKELNC